MRNRLKAEMLYSAGSSDGHSRGGRSRSRGALPYGYEKTTDIHIGIATDERIDELRKRFEGGRDLWTGEKI